MTVQYDSDGVAKNILDSLTQGLDFKVKDVDFDDSKYNLTPELLKALQSPLEKLTTDLITVRQVKGSGIFDAFMEAFSVHLWEEYENNRITGAEYTKAYIALAQSAMQYAVQFALGKDSAYWNALTAQVAAITANISNETAKVQLAIAQAQAHKTRAEYALTVAKLATEDAQYALVKENMEATRAQTMEARSDGPTVAGKTGKEKALLEKQVWAYNMDAEQKTASLYKDVWTTWKGTDENTASPTNVDLTQIGNVMHTLRNHVGL